MGTVGRLVSALRRLRQRPGLVVPATLTSVVDPWPVAVWVLGLALVTETVAVTMVAILATAALVLRAGLRLVHRPLFGPALARLGGSTSPAGGGGLGAGWQAIRATWGTAYGTQVAAIGWATVVGLLLAGPIVLGLAGVAILLPTAVEVPLYAAGLVESGHVQLSVATAAVLPVIGVALALTATGFAAVLAVAGAPARTAWHASLSACRHQPLATVGYLAGQALLVGGVATVWLLPALLGGPGLLLGLAGIVLTTPPVRALLECHRIAFAEEVVRPGTDAAATPTAFRWWLPRPSTPGLPTVLLVVLVVAAGGIRVTDVRPSATVAGPPMVDGEEPAERLERAAARTRGVSRVVTLRMSENVSRSPERQAVYRVEVDVPGRLLTVAADQSPRDGWKPDPLVALTDGQAVVEDVRSWNPDPGSEFATDHFQLAHRNRSVLVFTVETPSGLRALGPFRCARTDNASIHEASEVRVTVDAESGRFRRIVWRHKGRRYGGELVDRREVHVYRYTDVEPTLPADRDGKLAWLIGDLVYY